MIDVKSAKDFISEDERKGLLYGSLIAAGLAATRGKNIGDALTQGISGLGVAYAGGLNQIYNQKQAELERQRILELLELEKARGAREAEAFPAEMAAKELGLGQLMRRGAGLQQMSGMLAEQNPLLAVGLEAGAPPESVLAAFSKPEETITGNIVRDPSSSTGWSYASNLGNIIARGAPAPGAGAGGGKSAAEQFNEIDSGNKEFAWRRAVDAIKIKYPQASGNLDALSNMFIWQKKPEEIASMTKTNVQGEAYAELLRSFATNYYNATAASVKRNELPRGYLETVPQITASLMSSLTPVPAAGAKTVSTTAEQQTAAARAAEELKRRGYKLK
jgi:hypothetical protein